MEKNFSINYGESLKEQREKFGLSQSAVANKINTSHQNINMFKTMESTTVDSSLTVWGSAEKGHSGQSTVIPGYKSSSVLFPAAIKAKCSKEKRTNAYTWK